MEKAMKKRLRKKLAKKYPLYLCNGTDAPQEFFRAGMIGTLGNEPNIIKVLPYAAKIIEARRAQFIGYDACA